MFTTKEDLALVISGWCSMICIFFFKHGRIYSKLQKSATAINAGPSHVSCLASLYCLADKVAVTNILITYAQNVTLFCSLFAAHLQFKWLFDQAGLQQNALSQAYNVY